MNEMNNDLFGIDLPISSGEKDGRICIDNKSMVNLNQTHSTTGIIALCVSVVSAMIIVFVIYKQINAMIISKTLTETVAK